MPSVKINVGLSGLMAFMTNRKFTFGLWVMFAYLCLVFPSCHEDQQSRLPNQREATDSLSETFTFSNWLKVALQAKDGSSIPAIDSIHRASIVKLYQATEGNPVWIQRNGQAANAKQWLQVLQDIHADGLDSSDYFISEIRHLARKSQKNRSLPDSTAFQLELLLTSSFIKLSTDMLCGTHASQIRRKEWKNRNDSLFDPVPLLLSAIENTHFDEAIQDLRPRHPAYSAMQNEYLRLRRIQQNGGWPYVPTLPDSAWQAAGGSEILKLRKRLFIELGIPADTLATRWSNELGEAIEQFQYLNHLKTSGNPDSATTRKLNVSAKQKMGILLLNMERMRWLTQTFKQPYIWVNVPAMELRFIDGDSIRYAMRVVVGRPSRPTTMLDAKLQNIVFSPPWTVPPTIMKEEVIPGIARKGSAYLRRRGLKAYDLNGKAVDPAQITRANFSQYRVGQAPGYNSSLGEVKFNLLNPWSIYLHDTPHREDFEKRNRALSSGCIRVHRPKEFAELLLADSINYSLTKIDSICSTRKTKYVSLQKNIMVHIVYLTNAPDSSGRMIYLNDVYRWDHPN